MSKKRTKGTVPSGFHPIGKTDNNHYPVLKILVEPTGQEIHIACGYMFNEAYLAIRKDITAEETGDGESLILIPKEVMEMLLEDGWPPPRDKKPTDGKKKEEPPCPTTVH